MNRKHLTLKDLQKQTNATAYLIQYLKACNRLIVTTPSKGQGYPTIYHSNSIQVIKDHMDKRTDRLYG